MGKISTTQSIWRSGGGDATRASYCGSGVMAAQFYVADASVVSSTNVKVSSASGAPVLVLPQGAVVLSVVLNDAGAGHVDLGTTVIATGSNSAASIASNLAVDALGTVTAGLTNTGINGPSYVTVKKNVDGAGTVGGYITYFVVDPSAGQQNV